MTVEHPHKLPEKKKDNFTFGILCAEHLASAPLRRKVGKNDERQKVFAQALKGGFNSTRKFKKGGRVPVSSFF